MAFIKKPNSKLASYIAGFVSSIACTLLAYMVVQIHVSSEHSLISHEVLIPTILGLAVIQFIIQLAFFLHLGSDAPRASWKTPAFIATIGMVLLVVVGAIWIMGHLNYNMMASPNDTDQYIQSQDGL